MHELPVIESILKVVEKHAHANKVNKVIGVQLQVGELSDLEDEWMQQYFDHLSRGGIADGAILKIERIPVVMQCNACRMSFAVNIREEAEVTCPACGGEQHTMVSGREYFVKNLEAL